MGSKWRWRAELVHCLQACLRLTDEQREKLVAVTARFQHQRSTLLAQRQGIYTRLQRPSERGTTVSDEAIDEFLKVCCLDPRHALLQRSSYPISCRSR